MFITRRLNDLVLYLDLVVICHTNLIIFSLLYVHKFDSLLLSTLVILALFLFYPIILSTRVHRILALSLIADGFLFIAKVLGDIKAITDLELFNLVSLIRSVSE